MQSLNYPRGYSATGEHAAFRPTRRPRRDAVLSVVDRRFALDGVKHPMFFTALQEAACFVRNDAEVRATIKRIIGDGFNALILHELTMRASNESAWNWGPWLYPINDATQSNRWLMDETVLVQLDKLIAWAGDEGIEAFLISLEGYADATLRHPSAVSGGTYQSRGMMWSPTWRQMHWDLNSRILLRVNTITGQRYIDNPRIIWRFNNECSFSDVATRPTTSSWGGGSSVTWFAKIVDGITDSLGANGDWYPELNSTLTAWRDAHAPGWTIPAWGRGGAAGFPKQETWAGWGNATDKETLVDFLGFNDREYIVDLIGRVRALNPNAVMSLGTFNYLDPMAHLGLSDELIANTIVDTHHYFPDGVSQGVKFGSVTTRKSILDNSWSYVTNGAGWELAMGGVRSSRGGFLSSECGQYGPSRWRYQRLYYEAIVANANGFDIATLSQSQQYLVQQYTNDGRYQQGEHVVVASPCERLACRALAPVLRYGFLSEHPTTFTIRSNPDSLKTLQHAALRPGLSGFTANPTYNYDGSENAWAGTKNVLWEIDDSYTQTSDWSTFPKVLDGTLASGTFMRNTATEKVYVKANYGTQLMTPYMVGFYDTLVEKAAADAIFAMPMYLSNMAAAVSCAVCFLRSDGLWPLFTGPMKLYIHGSDYSDNVVLQGLNGATYQQGTPGQYGTNNPPGAAYFMANDGVTVYYAASNSQTWGDGNSTPANTYLMMPESFTLNLDTSAMGGTDLEIFGVDKDGIPHRLASSYNPSTKVWSFNYTGAYPEYTLQPKVTSNVLSHLEAP